MARRKRPAARPKRVFPPGSSLGYSGPIFRLGSTAIVGSPDFNLKHYLFRRFHQSLCASYLSVRGFVRPSISQPVARGTTKQARWSPVHAGGRESSPSLFATAPGDKCGWLLLWGPTD